MNNKENIFPKIPLPTSDGYELIRLNKVLFCEADDNCTYFNIKNKKKIIACRMLKYVRGEGGYVNMSDGSSVNVSR
jgi:two-component system LytT family response regulator